MGSIDSGTVFDDAIQNGLTNYANNTVEVELFADSTGTPFSSTTANPVVKPAIGWGRNGSQVANSTTQWGEWESDTAGETIDHITVEQDIGDGNGMTQFLTVDGGEFDNSHNIENGTNVTVTPGFLEMVYPGLAEVILNAEGNVGGFDCSLYDGSDSLLGGTSTITGISWSFNASTRQFTLGADVVFTNDSGGDWNVERVRIHTGNGNKVYDDGSISETVPNGADLTFTQLQQDITI